MKEYLGDGVYVDLDDEGLVLTTEIGGPVPTNTIYLEPDVLMALLQYVARRANFAREAQR